MKKIIAVLLVALVVGCAALEGTAQARVAMVERASVLDSI